MAKNEFKTKCVKNLRCSWQDLPMLYCSTSRQLWLSRDRRGILHYIAAMSGNNNEHTSIAQLRLKVTLYIVI